MRRAASAVTMMLMLSVAAFAEPSDARKQEILQLLHQDCGSCHGLTLKGGLGPALTPQALAGRSPEALSRTILDGLPGTPMAPWRPFLDESEATWLAQRLLQGKTDAP